LVYPNGVVVEQFKLEKQEEPVIVTITTPVIEKVIIEKTVVSKAEPLKHEVISEVEDTNTRQTAAVSSYSELSRTPEPESKNNISIFIWLFGVLGVVGVAVAAVFINRKENEEDIRIIE